MSTDYQRQKVYNAERELGFEGSTLGFSVHEKVSIPEVNALYRKWAKKFKVAAVPEVEINRRYRQTSGMARGVWGGYQIQFATDTPKLFVVLHEFAHCLAGVGAGHGWSFAAALLKLYEHHLGVDAALALSRCFDRKGVIYTKAQGEKRVKRLRKAAAASENRDDETGVGWVLVFTPDLATDHGAAALQVGGYYRTRYLEDIKVYRREHNAYRRLDRMMRDRWEVWKVVVRYVHELRRWVPDGRLEEVRLDQG